MSTDDGWTLASSNGSTMMRPALSSSRIVLSDRITVGAYRWALARSTTSARSGNDRVMDDQDMWGAVPEAALQRIAVVSPHFDDAALGAAHLLSSYPGTTVITVCGGPPESYPDEPTDWDTAGGFVAGDYIVAIRREEDRAAMALVDATPIWLDFVDWQYLGEDE